MRVQKNSNTGEYRADLGDGNFVPARVQRNGSTGEMRVIVAIRFTRTAPRIFPLPGRK